MKKIAYYGSSGVPKGYTHNWKYLGRWWEKKIAPGKWKFRFAATKGKKSGRGGPKRGFKIHWGFKNVNQKAVKLGPGRYQTVMTGIKYTKKAGYKSKRRKRYGKKGAY